MPSRRKTKSVDEARAAWLLLAPALLLLIVARLLPIGNGIWTSFLEPVSGGGTRVGGGNYEFLFFHYPIFFGSVVTTMSVVVIAGLLQTGLAMVLALLFAQTTRSSAIMRTIILLPLAVPIAASTSVWGIIYRPEGPLNAIFAAMGIAQQPFLTSSSQALFCIVIILSWCVTGYWMTVLAAGLNDIPKSLYEAVRIDGAGPIASFFYISLPMLRRPLVFLLVASTVSNFLAFAPMQILTRGGPIGTTNVALYEIYTQAYANYDIGLASAEVVLCLIVLGALVAVQFKLLSSAE